MASTRTQNRVSVYVTQRWFSPGQIQVCSGKSPRSAHAHLSFMVSQANWLNCKDNFVYNCRQDTECTGILVKIVYDVLAHMIELHSVVFYAYLYVIICFFTCQLAAKRKTWLKTVVSCGCGPYLFRICWPVIPGCVIWSHATWKFSNNEVNLILHIRTLANLHHLVRQVTVRVTVRVSGIT